MGARVVAEYEAEKSPLGLRENLATVWRLLKNGIDFPPTFERSKESELRELVAPHVPVLAHKCARYATLEYGVERWAQELHAFVEDTLLPLKSGRLHVTGNDRNRLVRVIDTYVREEMERAQKQVLALPVTSRFDTSWAV